MASVNKIMGAGLAPLAAQAINGVCSNNLTATGSNQATALLLPADINIVSTAAASTGVILPTTAAAGDEVVVANLGANTLAVYPPVGGTIQAGSANAAFSVATLKTSKFINRAGGLDWAAMLSA